MSFVKVRADETVLCGRAWSCGYIAVPAAGLYSGSKERPAGAVFVLSLAVWLELAMVQAVRLFCAVKLCTIELSTSPAEGC